MSPIFFPAYNMYRFFSLEIVFRGFNLFPERRVDKPTIDITSKRFDLF